MRRRTWVFITIVTIVGLYMGIFYLRRIRGYEFPIADGLAWRITVPPQRLRSWIGIDLRWRKLVARSWQTGNGGTSRLREMVMPNSRLIRITMMALAYLEPSGRMTPTMRERTPLDLQFGLLKMV